MKISTILPLYNGKEFIKEAIESVCKQSYTNWELIIINDGSTDDSFEYVKSYVFTLVEKEKIILLNQKNAGVAVARNNAIAKSGGEWIALLDQDDCFHHDKFKIMISYLDCDSNVDVIISDRFKINNETTRIDVRSSMQKKKTFSKADILSEMILANGIAPIDTLFRKKAFLSIGALDSSLKVSNDWDLWIRFAQNQHPFKYIQKPLAFYRIHATNTSKNAEAFIEERFRILKKFFLSSPSSYQALKKKAFAFAYIESANPRFNEKKYKLFRNDVKRILYLYPKALSFKILKRYVISFFLEFFRDSTI